MKRRTILWISVLMIATAFVYAEGATETTSGASDTPTVSWMMPHRSAPVVSDTWYIAYLGEKAGVKYEMIPVPRESFDTKLTTLLASGNVPDVISYFRDPDTYKKYGSRLFAALDPFLESGRLSNYQEWLDEYPVIREVMEDPDDGNLYAFVEIRYPGPVATSIHVRNDKFKAAGWDASRIKTLDDLKSAFMAAQQQHIPGEYILGHRGGYSLFVTWKGHLFGVDEGMLLDVLDPDGTGKWVWSPAEPEYKEFVAFYRWCYENGILHPDFMTMTNEELTAKEADGTFIVHMSNLVTGHSKLNPESADNRDVRQVALVGPVSINETVYRQFDSPPYSMYRSPFTVSKECPAIDKVMSMFNWCYGKEGSMLRTWGVKNVHWVWDDSMPNGFKIIAYPHATNGNDESLPPSPFSGQPYAGYIPHAKDRYMMFGKAHDGPGAPETNQIEIDDAVMRAGGAATPFRKPISLTSAVQSEVTEIEAPLRTFVEERTVQFIIGQRSMDEWDSFINTMERMGYKDLVKLYNDNY